MNFIKLQSQNEDNVRAAFYTPGVIEELIKLNIPKMIKIVANEA